ncbi:MAG: hypothetical protein R3C59_06860 [Planctomycetaceae bacterium]
MLTLLAIVAAVAGCEPQGERPQATPDPVSTGPVVESGPVVLDPSTAGTKPTPDVPVALVEFPDGYEIRLSASFANKVSSLADKSVDQEAIAVALNSAFDGLILANPELTPPVQIALSVSKATLIGLAELNVSRFKDELRANIGTGGIAIRVYAPSRTESVARTIIASRGNMLNVAYELTGVNKWVGDRIPDIPLPETFRKVVDDAGVVVSKTSLLAFIHDGYWDTRALD